MTNTNLVPWGILSILDFSECDESAIKDEANLTAWITELLAVAGTTAASNLLIVKTNAGTEKEGLVISQIANDITVTAEVAYKERHVYVDILINNDLNPELLANCTVKYFGAKPHLNTFLVPRNASARAPE